MATALGILLAVGLLIMVGGFALSAARRGSPRRGGDTAGDTGYVDGGGMGKPGAHHHDGGSSDGGFDGGGGGGGGGGAGDGGGGGGGDGGS